MPTLPLRRPVSGDADRRLVLGGGSVELRRRLGPTAWVVFEELLLASSDTAEGCLACVSVRALGARLGLAKDTVARALIRLRRAGLVTPAQSRASNGVFATGSYVLVVPDSISIHRASSNKPRARSQSCSPRSTDSQLVLAIDC
jgi:DNA-binding transcriptional ArsR family regulator